VDSTKCMLRNHVISVQNTKVERVERVERARLQELYGENYGREGRECAAVCLLSRWSWVQGSRTCSFQVVKIS